MSSSWRHGVKGSDVHSTTGDQLVDLYTMLNRGLKADKIESSVTSIMAMDNIDIKRNLMILAFQTRDIRGVGKGERDLFFNIIKLDVMKDMVSKCLSLIPEYGRWDDLFQPEIFAMHKEKILNLVKTQLEADEKNLKEEKSISLLAKWLPREHKSTPEDIVIALANHITGFTEKKSLMYYRKRVSALNKKLNTVEIMMCSKHFADIEPEKVTGRSTKLYTKAFLNQPVKKKHGRKEISILPDRIECAKHFKTYFSRAAKGEIKMKGANVVYPHELVAKILDSSNDFSEPELDAIEGQWRSIVEDMRVHCPMLKDFLAMIDCSGSMMGIPIQVSIALGLLIAELNTGPFKNTVMTFDSTPTLLKFTTTGLVNRIREIRHLAQGTSTDFQAAYNLIIKHFIEFGKFSDVTLVVLTDMGFDQACGAGQSSYYTGNFNTYAVKTKAVESHIQIARRAFVKQSELINGDGQGCNPPQMVIWNLQETYSDFQATADEEGVMNMSGWSPSILKVLGSQGFVAAAATNTPATALKMILDNPCYDKIRHALA
jgi:hypothetical protein